ncbi:divergent PAP2 family protein [Alkaliphilus serpentinus]|uniref:Divergent PAP2 family protein n=1 Tax=Alkaliphilus serpentinus TaxID=1482731 RepID=A0A833MD76_9FIRM|nr:divergent PAP2 family protein [Alkaliphilus serpentinus]KAB3527565.1 divergent PAP2 family protein [Alkaliphilus serpentinus]
MYFLESIGNNKILWASVLAWFIAQSLKVIHSYVVDRRFNIWRFVGSGGMPSSHSAFVMGLSTSIGLTHGWDSSIFALAFSMSLIVMYDAAGVRRAVGKQAIILNRILADFHTKKEKKLTEKRLKELVGHTPVEVLAGAFLGIIIANLVI